MCVSVSAAVDNSGSQTWRIPVKLVPGTYYLRLQSTTDLTNYETIEFLITEESSKRRSLLQEMYLRVIGDWSVGGSVLN